MTWRWNSGADRLPAGPLVAGSTATSMTSWQCSRLRHQRVQNSSGTFHARPNPIAQSSLRVLPVDFLARPDTDGCDQRVSGRLAQLVGEVELAQAAQRVLLRAASVIENVMPAMLGPAVAAATNILWPENKRYARWRADTNPKTNAMPSSGWKR
jgi:hypothetical protein